MEIIARYIHGSYDSTDTDVIYIVDELPDKGECKKWCSEDPLENRNLATIVDGHVDKVYKGSPDEMNNALLRTYPLHKQEYPLLVLHNVQRDYELKAIRSLRMILSHLSRTQMRQVIKSALHSNWQTRLVALRRILDNWGTIVIDDKNHHMKAEDILKVIAFQVGQMLGLVEGKELYTKYEISQQYPFLKSYLYREEKSLHRDNYGLELGLWKYLYALNTHSCFEIDPFVIGTNEKPMVKFVMYGKEYDLISETLVACDPTICTEI